MKEPDVTDRTAVQLMDEGMFQFQHFYWYSGLMNAKIRIHTHIILHSAELYTHAVLPVSSGQVFCICGLGCYHFM